MNFLSLVQKYFSGKRVKSVKPSSFSGLRGVSKFNNTDSLLVVSSYPPKGSLYGEGVGGVASYTKNIVLPLLKVRNGRIIVLAEILDKPETYVENGILVIRCWKRNSLFLYKDILKQVITFNKVKQILVQFEFALYGDFTIASLFPVFMLLLRLSGRIVTTSVHQILTDLNSLSGHIGLHKNSFYIKLFEVLLKKFYKLLVFGSNNIVVLEKEFERRLIRLGVKPNKIVTIEHGVDLKIKRLSKNEARRQLGYRKDEKVLLVFGFLTWYKGSDLVVNAFSKAKLKNTKLVLAGGKSVTQEGKIHYRNFIDKLYRNISKKENIKITGFVPENKVKLYFSAADLVVLPYRTFMSSSGILSLTLSYAKPFIVSEPLLQWFENGQKGYLRDVVSFKANTKGLMEVLKKTKGGKLDLVGLETLSKKMRLERDYEKIAWKYAFLLEKTENVFNSIKFAVDASEG